MNNVSKVYIGVDISKDHLDVYIHPIGRIFKVKNSKLEIQNLIADLSKYDIARIGCEATGGYEKLLSECLQQNNHCLWIIDPRRIKGFIVAQGCKSKTDKIDAQKIAQFVSQNFKDFEPINKSEKQVQLLSLVNRKNDLIKFLAAEKTRLKHPSHSLSVLSIKKLMKVLEKEIKTIDKQIQNLIDSDSDLSSKSKILESIPGIGKASAAVLLSSVPELGILSNSKVSALVGVCPYNNESGKYKGKAFIKGGRIAPRKMLYMCALTTVKYNLILKAFYNRLIEKKKPFKIAIVAVMRKLIILANSLLKKGEICKI